MRRGIKIAKLLNCYIVVASLCFSHLLFGIPEVYAQVSDHLVISEVQIAGTKTTDDFIEIYNPTNQDIELNGYRLVKRTKTGTSDTTIKSFGVSDTISAFGFYLWANSDYTDIATTPDATTSQAIASDNGIALRNGAEDTGAIVDSVAWGEATNIFIEGSVFATAPVAGQSMERKPGEELADKGNGEDGDDNSADFVLREVPYPQNSLSNIEIPEGMSLPEEEPVVYSTKILINEFLPAPGSVTDWDRDGEANSSDEWIELINLDDLDIDLGGWTLDDIEDGGSSAYTIPENTMISPDGFMVFYKKDTGLVFNNTGDSVILKNPNSEIVDQYSYATTSSDESFGRSDNSDTSSWVDNYPPSPGGLNVAPFNNYPIANAGSNIVNAKSGEAIGFNGSGSFDPDGSIVSYEWNFGDGSSSSGTQVSHTYSDPGTYQVSLSVCDNSGAKSTATISVGVIENEAPAPYQNQFSGQIKISEILPNPSGVETESEYIKIFNFGSIDVNLRNWILDDAEGGSKPFKIDYDSLIKSKSVMIFNRAETGIALNNTGDRVRLFDPDNKIMDEVIYTDGAAEDAHYILENGAWRWDAPAKESVSDIAKEGPDEKIVAKDFSAKNISPPPVVIPAVPNISKIAIKEAPLIPLTKIEELVKVQEIPDIFVDNGVVFSSLANSPTPIEQRDLMDETLASESAPVRRPYQNPMVVVFGGLMLVGVFAKMLVRPEDILKIKQALPGNTGEDLKKYEDLFKQ